MLDHKNPLKLDLGFEFLEHRHQTVVDDEEAILRMVGDPGDLVGVEPKVKRVQNGTRRRHAKMSFQVNVMVPHERGYTVALLDAGRLQALCQAARPPADTAPRGAVDRAVRKPGDDLHCTEI